jgi:hypothetical protein
MGKFMTECSDDNYESQKSDRAELPLENYSTASALGSDNNTAKYYSKKKEKAE